MALPIQIRRVINVIVFFLFMIGCIATVYTQVVFGVIFRNNPPNWKNAINMTKYHFFVLLIFTLTNASPTDISVTYDSATLPNASGFKENSDGTISVSLMPNSVLISNHQMYVDWAFMWYLTYLSNLSNYVHIILKDSLATLPVLGYGMKNFNFMFLSRKWEKDKVTLTNQLLELDADARGSGPASGVKFVASTNIANGIGGIKTWPEQSITKTSFPYEVLLYPEGTVPSIRTRGVSKTYAEKVGRPLMKHVLLPRARGMFLTLHKLRNTVEVLYDITTGYSDLNEGEIAEDKFTLRDVFIHGKSPKKVNYHIRSFLIKDIPLGEENIDIDAIKDEDFQKFEDWLYEVWYEKDELMDNFFKYGTFVEPGVSGHVAKNVINGKIKLRSIFETISPFATALLTINLIYLVYKVIGFFI